MRELCRALLDLLLPSGCARCGGSAGVAALCPSCLARLPRFPQDAPRPAPLPLEAVVAGAPFEGEWSDWLHRFKYPRPGFAGLDPAADAVARDLCLRAAGQAPGPLPEVIVPVPLHGSRLRERGFNPAALLAECLARHTARPCQPERLQRIRATPHQTGLSRGQRRRNVAGAFRARAPVSGRIWLVDDVITTGATLVAAARSLRSAGAGAIVGICAARTLEGRSH